MSLTLQDYVNAFEAANKSATDQDNLAGDPTRWGVVRGVEAVIALERERCAKMAQDYYDFVFSEEVGTGAKSDLAEAIRAGT